MIYVLTVGHYHFAFESMKGLDTVVRTLAKGLRVETDFSKDKLSWKPLEEDRPVKIDMETDSSLSITKGKARASWQPERVVVTPEVVRDELFGERSSPRQIAGSKCLPAFSNKAIRQ